MVSHWRLPTTLSKWSIQNAKKNAFCISYNSFIASVEDYILNMLECIEFISHIIVFFQIWNVYRLIEDICNKIAFYICSM